MHLKLNKKWLLKPLVLMFHQGNEKGYSTSPNKCGFIYLYDLKTLQTVEGITFTSPLASTPELISLDFLYSE